MYELYVILMHILMRPTLSSSWAREWLCFDKQSFSFRHQYGEGERVQNEYNGDGLKKKQNTSTRLKSSKSAKKKRNEEVVQNIFDIVNLPYSDGLHNNNNKSRE